MTDNFKRALIALAAGAFLAGGAQAEDAVRISILGKDPKAVHDELIRAARHVCVSESAAPHYTLESDRDVCVRDTLAKAEGEYRQMKGLQLAMAHGG